MSGISHPSRPHSASGAARVVCVLLLFRLLGVNGAAADRDLARAREQFLAGRYTDCVTAAEKALKDDASEDEWHSLRVESLLNLGRYPQARMAITNALVQVPRSLTLRWLAHEVYLSNGRTNEATQMLDDVVQFVARRPNAYREATDLVTFGRAALLKGADPRRVLDRIYANAKKADPKLREAYLASGELALDKHDFALAARTFEEGLKQLPGDPDLNFGRACAYAPSDPALMLASVEAALSRNSNHVGTLLLLVDHQLDAEDYPEAGRLLDRIQAVNPWHPDAWAYRAVLAQLRNRPAEESAARENAYKFRPANPRVDFLIGRKLSQKYRFAEGAAHQRQALQFNPDYLPAKAQLAQDLLRLGEEDEGWRLADEVQKQDGYDVAAYNLTTLHDTLRKFATLTNQDFVVRMNAREAGLYGAQVLELLGRAREALCAKYGFELARPTVVEVFPEQKDFAVRTFGMPGNPGYLGVCFGRVITATSPASHPGHPVNWQAVLWHEFCHVVTLQLTHNKMPRWLSEGISVYEESQANPVWGKRMTPRYRELILGDGLTPISTLSAAFLSPSSDEDLQFAYFESSLVVEFLVQRFGVEALKAVLRDLGDGAEINAAIEKNTEPMAKLEPGFVAFARDRANQLGPGLDWERPANLTTLGAGPHPKAPPGGLPRLRIPGADDPDWEAWARNHPTNFWVMARQAREWVEGRQWTEAKTVLQRLVEQCPEWVGSDSPYRMLAAAHRALGETNQEQAVLTRFAARDGEATDACLRLMELLSATRDWPGVVENAGRYLAVDPLVAAPYRYLAQAAEKSGRKPEAIRALQALLELDPPDPAEVHFRLARLLHEAGDPAAKRHVLRALEEAPRYRDALRLLLETRAAESNAPARPLATTAVPSGP